MKKKSKQSKYKRHVSEPFPISECVDFQRLFSFPLAINHCSISDFNNNNNSADQTLNFLSATCFSPSNFKGIEKDEHYKTSTCEKNCVKNATGLSIAVGCTLGIPSNQTEERPITDVQETPIIQPSIPAPEKPPRKSERKRFYCNNKLCGKSELLLGEIELKFRSCKHCFTHYCSVKCQQICQTEHLRECYYSNVYHYVETLENLMHSNKRCNEFYFNHAWLGYKQKGRGCLFITFLCVDDLIAFPAEGIHLTPTYASDVDILKTTASSRYQRNLLYIIRSYKPAEQFLINIAVIIDERATSNPVPRKRENCVKKLMLVQHEDKMEVSYGILFSGYDSIDHNNKLTEKHSNALTRCHSM